MKLYKSGPKRTNADSHQILNQIALLFFTIFYCTFLYITNGFISHFFFFGSISISTNSVSSNIVFLQHYTYDVKLKRQRIVTSL